MQLSDCPIGPVAATSDLDRARSFYEGKLGLSPADPPVEGLLQYACANDTTLAVYLSPEHAGKGTATLAAWAVEDIEAAVDALADRGVEFERYDEGEMRSDERGIVGEGAMRSAFFRDPDGNTFVVVQP